MACQVDRTKWTTLMYSDGATTWMAVQLVEFRVWAVWGCTAMTPTWVEGLGFVGGCTAMAVLSCRFGV